MAYETVEVPKNSIIVPRNYSFDESVEFLASVQVERSNRRQEYYELGDCDGVSPYTQTLNEIDRAIGRLKSIRSEMQRLASHVHVYNDNDYCDTCGKDGRA